MENKELYRKFLPKTTKVRRGDKLMKQLDTIQQLFDYLVKTDFSAARLKGDYVKNNKKKLRPHVSRLVHLPSNKDQIKAIYFMKLIGHESLDKAVTDNILGDEIHVPSRTLDECEGLVKDLDYFKSAVKEIKNYFSKPLSIVLNGSFITKGMDATDLDLKLGVDNLNWRSYAAAIQHAKTLEFDAKNMNVPPIRFMMIPKKYFKSFATADPNTHFTEGIVVNSSYSFKPLRAPFKKAINLVYAVRKLHDLEERQKKTEELPRFILNAKMRDAFYVTETLTNMFGDRGLILPKTNEVDLKGLTQKEILKTAFNNTQMVIDTYKSDLKHFEVNYNSIL